MNTEKILRGILSKAFKLDSAKIDELLKLEDGDAETQILDLDKTRVTELTKPREGQTFADGHKKGLKEGLTKLEKEAKEKYGVDADVTGIDLIDAIVDEKVKATGKPKEITPDDVRKHPVFVEADKAAKLAIKKVTDNLTKQLTDKDAEFTKKEVLTSAQQKAWAIVEGLKPVLSKVADVAQTHKENFLQALSQYDYQKNNDGSFTISKDGKVLEDGHGHNIGFDDLVKNTSNRYFEFNNNNGGSNGGNDNNDHNPVVKQEGYPANITKPKTFSEYETIMNNDKLPAADRLLVGQVWDKEHSNM